MAMRKGGREHARTSNDNSITHALMQSLLSRHQQDAPPYSYLTVPVLLFATTILMNIFTPTKHALLTSAIAWLAICVFCTRITGARALLNDAPSRMIPLAAGGLFALAQLCERAVDGGNIRWAKVANTV
jgi:hypothetical protein